MERRQVQSTQRRRQEGGARMRDPVHSQDRSLFS